MGSGPANGRTRPRYRFVPDHQPSRHHSCITTITSRHTAPIMPKILISVAPPPPSPPALTHTTHPSPHNSQGAAS